MSFEKAWDALATYYSDPDVCARLLEYCGGQAGVLQPMAALQVAGYGGRRRLQERDGAPVAHPSLAWPGLLADGADVCRSFADAHGTLLQLDVDYVSPSRPGDPYRQPEECFARLEPVYEAVTDTFSAYGLKPIVLMTGRGYHFTLRASADGPLWRSLVDLGSRAGPWPLRYSRLTSLARVGVEMQWAHQGAGRLMEFLAHKVLRRTRGRTVVPVELADVAPPGRGPFICLDLTAYADPLLTRHTRCAFSGNQKALISGAAPERPVTIVLPREVETFRSLLEVRTDPMEAARRARYASARVPDVGEAADWLSDYHASRLARFHAEFDRGPEGGVPCPRCSLAGLDPAGLPGCARSPLDLPNPSLLQPTHLRTLSLALWSLGWHPRSVAALVRSRFEEEHGWEGLWDRYDPAGRADFYVRTFCGAVAAGLDETFDCQTQAARGLCPGGGCGYVLGQLLHGLRARLPPDGAPA